MEVVNSKYIVYVVLDIYPCATGGVEIFYHNHLKEIAKKTNVALITCCDKSLTSDLQIIKIHRRFLNIKGTGRIAKLIYTAIALIKRKQMIQYVHLPYTSNAGKWGIIFPLLSKIFGIKYILYHHGGRMRKWSKLGFDRLLFLYAKNILAVSEIIKKEYEARINRNINVVYPLSSFKTALKNKQDIKEGLGIAADEKVILFVGSLKLIKNPDILLNAFIALGIDFIEAQNLKLVFVGDGQLRNQMEKIVNNNEVAPFVLFAGKIPNEQIPLYYKMADYYVIPSRFEGTPITLIEAMYNQLPIIGAAVGGIQNIIVHNENGLLFNSGSVNHLKQQLLFLLENQSKASLMANEANKLYNQKFAKNLALKIFLGNYNN